MRFVIIIFTFIFTGCSSADYIIVNPPKESSGRIEQLKKHLENSDGDDVMVVAHRGVWDNAPENSIRSIEDAIELGVDMVELDIRKTLDGELVLMHDAYIDRMTDGVGLVAEMTLAELKNFNLRNRNGGAITEFKIPTLQEAMLAAKGKILVRIDKAYADKILHEVMSVLEATETVDHACILVSQSIQPGSVVFNWPSILDKTYFTPGVDADGSGGPSQAAGYLNYDKVVALESSFADDTKITINWRELRASGVRIMVYTGNSGSCGGHDDDISLTNIDEGFGWLIDRGVNMIQTDQPQFLLNYLRLKGLHE